MYGGFWIDIHAPITQVQGGAGIMYYGGDIAELLLAAALVATWRPEGRSRPRDDTPLPRDQPARASSSPVGHVQSNSSGSLPQHSSPDSSQKTSP